MEVSQLKLEYFSNIPLSTYGKVIGPSVLLILGWEHFGRGKNLNCRPSVALRYISNKLTKFFGLMGCYSARMSSYLTYFNMEELRKTLSDVSRPATSVVLSPFRFLVGYMEQASTYQKESKLVYLGSGLLLVALSFLCYKYISASPNLGLNRLLCLFRG